MKTFSNSFSHFFLGHKRSTREDTVDILIRQLMKRDEEETYGRIITFGENITTIKGLLPTELFTTTLKEQEKQADCYCFTEHELYTASDAVHHYWQVTFGLAEARQSTSSLARALLGKQSHAKDIQAITEVYYQERP